MAADPGEIAAIVLAAGAGARMGGNKARLLVPGPGGGDEPLAHAHARRMHEAGAGDVLLVTRADVAPSFDGPPEGAEPALRVVVSRAEDAAGSLALGVGAWRSGLARGARDAILIVTPVDAWPAELATIAALIAAVRAGAEAATPRMARGARAGRGGHPVVVRASLFDDVVGRGERAPAAPFAPLNERLAALGERRVRVDVDDAAILTDLDTPEDLAAVLRPDRPAVPEARAPAPRFWAGRIARALA